MLRIAVFASRVLPGLGAGRSYGRSARLGACNRNQEHAKMAEDTAESIIISVLSEESLIENAIWDKAAETPQWATAWALVKLRHELQDLISEIRHRWPI